MELKTLIWLSLGNAICHRNNKIVFARNRLPFAVSALGAAVHSQDLGY